MIVVTTVQGASYGVNVDSRGWIILDHYGPFGERRLSHAEAAELAGALLEGIRLSRDRNQIGTAAYHSTKNITWRAESPLGKAQTAVRRIFG